MVAFDAVPMTLFQLGRAYAVVVPPPGQLDMDQVIGLSTFYDERGGWRIRASDNLDEYVLQSLLAQGTSIDRSIRRRLTIEGFS